jgi:aerobic-type carbon monoxide dehydrogenase small subunit (CoxS/CutS family)
VADRPVNPHLQHTQWSCGRREEAPTTTIQGQRQKNILKLYLLLKIQKTQKMLSRRDRGSDLMSPAVCGRAAASGDPGKATQRREPPQGEAPMSEHDLSPTCTVECGDASVQSDGSRTPQNVRASRREFIKGVIASGVAVSAAGYVVVGRGGEALAQAAGTVTRLVTLNVNGRDRPVDVLPNETLIHTLRYKLGLTGTKLGCDHSECGNCTVMLDDIATYSCSTLTHSVRGRKIVTIEGIEGPNGELHPVQKAMIQELGPQCGFCTPGQVVSAVALLKRNPKPTVEEARIAMSGNLCRCGAYDHYLKAVLRASREA